MTREYIDNDDYYKIEQEELAKAYGDMLDRRRAIEEEYQKLVGTVANNTPEGHNTVNEDEEHEEMHSLQLNHDTPNDETIAAIEEARLLKGFTITDSRGVSDPIVQNVINKFTTRHRAGMKTYGITLDENPAPTLTWLNHVQEELMDAILYLERLKKNIK